MGWLPLLAPLYLGALAMLSIPLVLHFIRRSPQGRLPFSTLMFLKPSPPRMTRRSRLDNLLLLLLRALAIALIVLAFCRPFLRFPTQADSATASGRAVVIVVDRSASMRRGDLWQQAINQVDEALGELTKSDRVCLLVYGDEIATLVPFPEQNDAMKLDLQQQQTLVREAIRATAPGWGATRSADALLWGCEILAEQSSTADSSLQDRLQIVLISDLQRGSDLDALQAFEWPQNIKLSIKQMKVASSGNAIVNVLSDRTDADLENGIRVRVTNTSDADSDQFRVEWLARKQPLMELSDKSPDQAPNNFPPTTAIGVDSQLVSAGQRIDVQVPAGQSRVVQLAVPVDSQPIGIRLQGDAGEFDNLHFVGGFNKQRYHIEFVADATGESKQSPLFYFRRIFDQADHFIDAVEPAGMLIGNPLPDLLVITSSVDQQADRVKTYLQNGGRVILLITSANMQQTTRLITDETSLALDEADVKNYALLGEIDFRHPLFLPFADPKFNDFTAPHFWKYRRLTFDKPPADAKPSFGKLQTIARFDNGDPAILHQTLGKGQLFVQTSGWQPTDSQLAVSMKFVPLLLGMLGQRLANDSSADYFVVGQQMRFAFAGDQKNRDGSTSPQSVVLIDPSGDRHLLSADSDGLFAFLPQQPGIHLVQSMVEPVIEMPLVVNLDLRESETEPLAIEQFEGLRVQLGEQASDIQVAAESRQLQNLQLEAVQRNWSKLLFAAIAVLFVETILAGWFARKQNVVLGELS
jgi:Mg-chelatase subunit ChlD